MSLSAQRHVVIGSFTNTPPTPVLPSYTIRCKFSSGYTPTMGDTQTLVDAQENIWDIYKSSSNWDDFFLGCTDLLEVVDANTTGTTSMGSMFYGCSGLTSVSLFDTSSVTNMHGMFQSCSSLTSVPLFDTSSATNVGQMFEGCSDLTSVPLFDTSNATDMGNMFLACSSLSSVPLFDTSSATNMDYTFYSCTNVESGALALYQQASGQVTPPSSYSNCFMDCGSGTVTGAAELAQIPASWGGTGA